MADKKPSSFARNRELALQLLASQGFGQVSLRKLAGQGARQQHLDSAVVNHLALHLLEQLPLWLSAANLSAERQTALIEDLIQGLWYPLLERRQAPVITEGTRYAPVQRRSA